MSFVCRMSNKQTNKKISRIQQFRVFQMQLVSRWSRCMLRICYKQFLLFAFYRFPFSTFANNIQIGKELLFYVDFCFLFSVVGIFASTLFVPNAIKMSCAPCIRLFNLNMKFMNDWTTQAIHTNYNQKWNDDGMYWVRPNDVISNECADWFRRTRIR